MASAIGAASDYASRRRFRFLIALIVLALLWWYVLEAIERRAGDVEQLAAGSVFSQLQSAVRIKSAEAMLAQPPGYERRVDGNPFAWLDHGWSSYAGLCEEPVSKPGNWCFWSEERHTTVTGGKGWVIYTAKQPMTLDGRQVQGGKPLAWRVTTEYADRNNNGERERDERSTGLKLAPVVLEQKTVLTQDARH